MTYMLITHLHCAHVSWIAEANMLYLETPIGVGFSYSSDTSSYEGVNDKITGKFLALPSSFYLIFDFNN